MNAFTASIAAAIGLAVASPALAQTVVQPTNDAPNPYRTIEGWARMPEGRSWGSTSAVAVANDGVSIWVAERCGANSCVGSNLDPILLFDSTGTLVRSFGAGLMLFPHGIDVDSEGNVWVTDCACIGPAAADSTRGHQVFKFSAEGKLLMTLGKAGGAREPGFFFQPNDVLVTPGGDIYVSEGHSSREGANARILKFTKDGTLVASWGRRGTGPGEFDQPHALAMDSRGRLFVGDRSNNRIQILDQTGRFLEEWRHFSRPSGLDVDKDDMLYVADSESGSVARNRPEWKRGIRIGRATDGALLAFIPDPDTAATGTSAAEGVAVDARGHIYGAEVGPRALKKYVKR
ncbi:MAG TPA: peptidyl-alpha-hydroxyglycine alpha-amidating lyase family protein [Gemmatimonadales bacterium]|nr:peptidyl-alpha-hydroxyglycine alpha-amidating lyase family protein [Gemmatimonadales bacterium]